MFPKAIASLLFDLLLGSLRVRAFGAGLAVGALAAGLFARGDDVARVMAVVVIGAGSAATLCFALAAAPRRDRAARRRLAEQVLLFTASGVLLALQALRFTAG